MVIYRYPFNDPEHAALFAKIARGSFVVPDCLSSKARCIIRSLLRRDPDERITSEDIMLHPWLREDNERKETMQSMKIKSLADDHCVPDWISPDEGSLDMME